MQDAFRAKLIEITVAINGELASARIQQLEQKPP